MALLNWALFINSVHAFEIRVGAAACLRSYFKDNADSKSAFLSDQKKAYTIPNYYANLQNEEYGGSNGYSNGEANGKSENSLTTPYANIFSTLMDYDSETKLNPYRVWFAALILIYLFEDSNENKEIARNIKTGDEEAGAEVMKAIPAMASLLITTLDNMDPRISVGYLMLLTVWIYEDFGAVNDFLSDPSIPRSILAYLSDISSEPTVLVHGMATILLGVAYEFSSKDSPLPRADYHSLLVKALGKDNYSLKVKQFKESDIFKSFEEAQILTANKDETGLPDVFFNSVYVNLIKENFTRIKRALFHDPQAEPKSNINYEVFEDLDQKYTELQKEIAAHKESASANSTALSEKIAELEKVYEKTKADLVETTVQLASLKEDHSSVNMKYEETARALESMEKTKEEFELSSQKYQKELQDSEKKIGAGDELSKNLESKLETIEAAKKKLEDGINNMTRDLFHLKKQKGDAENAIKSTEKELASAKNELAKLKKTNEINVERLKVTSEEFKATVASLNRNIDSLKKDKESAVKELQERLDDAEANNEHLMDKLRSASVAFLEIKQSKSAVDEELSNLQKDLGSKEQALNQINEEMTKLAC